MESNKHAGGRRRVIGSSEDRDGIGVARRTLLAGTAAALAVSPLVTAHAQDYPTRPVRLISPYAPGGSTGVVSRLLAAKFQEYT